MKQLRQSFASILIASASLVRSVKKLLEKSVKRKQSKASNNYSTEPPNTPKPDHPGFEISTTYPPAKDEEWQKKQERFWERQICCAKVLNWVTIFGTLAALGGLGILYRTLKLTEIAVTAARDQADAAKMSVRLSEESLKITVNTFRLDQRAWVSTVGSISRNLKPGMKPSLGFAITNTGKTPALNLRGQIGISVLRKEEDFIPNYRKHESTDIASNTVLPPGMKIEMTLPLSELTQQIFDAYKTNIQILYLYGEFLYDDVFERPHYTRVCVFFDPDFATTKACPTYNDAN